MAAEIPFNAESWLPALYSGRERGDGRTALTMSVDELRRGSPMAWTLLLRPRVHDVAVRAGTDDIAAAQELLRVYNRVYVPFVSGQQWLGNPKAGRDPAAWPNDMCVMAVNALKQRAADAEAQRLDYAATRMQPDPREVRLNPREYDVDRGTLFTGFKAPPYTM